MPEAKSFDDESRRSAHSTFNSQAADASDLLKLIEQREIEEFGTAINRNESEEARTLRQIALKQIFAFLTDKSDARVMNLRVSKQGAHMKLSVNIEPRLQEPKKVVIAPDSDGRLNLYEAPMEPSSASEPQCSTATTMRKVS
uniref:T2SSE_N domain-containing protein n=1 Tax=Steinernema glaseri TaxID=37863 RepID=A0A1I7YKA6_9BILA